MASVYIETTIPSYYYETRRTPSVQAWRAVTRVWWNDHRLSYRLCTSRFVHAELAMAPAIKRTRAAALLSEMEILAEPDGLEEVVAFYIEHRLMPVEAGGDAVHLAMASMHNVDYLLTWNCRHLANANKTQHLRVLNGRLGLPVPIITTPMTLIPENH
jgi:hypothetical protein